MIGSSSYTFCLRLLLFVHKLESMRNFKILIPPHFEDLDSQDRDPDRQRNSNDSSDDDDAEVELSTGLARIELELEKLMDEEDKGVLNVETQEETRELTSSSVIPDLSNALRNKVAGCTPHCPSLRDILVFGSSERPIVKTRSKPTNFKNLPHEPQKRVVSRSETTY